MAAVAAMVPLLAPAPARGATSEWSANEQSRVRLITPYSVAPRQGELRLGLQFTLEKDWHVYWKNSGDAGFPPVLGLGDSLDGALKDAEILWPAPHRFELPGDLVAFGYSDEVVYPVEAHIQATGESLRILAELDYLICKVDCVPYRYTLTLEQPLGDTAAADPETAPLLDAWRARVPRPAEEISGLQTGGVIHQGGQGQDGPLLEVRVIGAEGQDGETGIFFEAHEAFDLGKPRERLIPGGVIFRVPVRPKQLDKELPAKTPLAWTVTGLTREGKNLNLEARREVEIRAEPAPLQEPVPAAAAATSGGLPRMLMLALLGGLLLNAMPTVLALLAVEALVLRTDPGGRTAVREKAAAAATGVLGSCWAVAALALAAHRAGLPAGWGSQLQEPALAALLAVATLGLTLNLWGLLEVPLAPAATAATGETAPVSGTGRHLLAGLFVAPLALAWPLPNLQEPVGFALESGGLEVCAIFAALGLGLALPYLLLAAVPSLALALPQPGRWVRTLREGLGFLAGASALWLLYALSHQVRPEGLAWVELTLLAMALFAWLRHRSRPRSVLKFGLAVALAAFAVAALWLADENRLSPRPARGVTSATQIPENTGG
jgi:suppressor for copper-sensitivity B